MPKDAKLGLVVGVALVIAVAVVFFRKDGPSPIPVFAEPSAAKPAQPADAQTGANNAAPPANQVSLQMTSRFDESSPQVHVVRPGYTLFTIAQQHYGDGERFHEIYRANRDVLRTPDNLPSGAKLRIP